MLILYLECQLKPHKSIVMIPLKVNQFLHKVHIWSEQYENQEQLKIPDMERHRGTWASNQSFGKFLENLNEINMKSAEKLLKSTNHSLASLFGLLVTWHSKLWAYGFNWSGDIDDIDTQSKSVYSCLPENALGSWITN